MDDILDLFYRESDQEKLSRFSAKANQLMVEQNYSEAIRIFTKSIQVIEKSRSYTAKKK